MLMNYGTVFLSGNFAALSVVKGPSSAGFGCKSLFGISGVECEEVPEDVALLPPGAPHPPPHLVVDVSPPHNHQALPLRYPELVYSAGLVVCRGQGNSRVDGS